MENAFYSLEGLFQFLNEGVSPFHAAAAAAKILESQGYVHWRAQPGRWPPAANTTPPATVLR